MKKKIQKGDKVKMSEKTKKELIKNGCKPHVDEFGDCIGIVGDPVFEDHPDLELDVYWQPSNLRYGYLCEHLIKIS